MYLTDLVIYLAGFFDGEGCVNFSKVRNTIVPRIIIVNTNREILQEFQEQFGGDITERKRVKANWKIAYHLRISNRRAIELLRIMYPYLRVKRRQAEIMFDFEGTMKGKGYRFSDEEKEYRQYLVQELSRLNKKGV